MIWKKYVKETGTAEADVMSRCGFESFTALFYAGMMIFMDHLGLDSMKLFD